MRPHKPRTKAPLVMLILMVTLGLSGCGISFTIDGMSEAEEHLHAGVELYDEGRLTDALTEYDKAIRLDPQLADAYANRGRAYQGPEPIRVCHR